MNVHMEMEVALYKYAQGCSIHKLYQPIQKFCKACIESHSFSMKYIIHGLLFSSNKYSKSVISYVLPPISHPSNLTKYVHFQN